MTPAVKFDSTYNSNSFLLTAIKTSLFFYIPKINMVMYNHQSHSLYSIWIVFVSKRKASHVSRPSLSHFVWRRCFIVHTIVTTKTYNNHYSCICWYLVGTGFNWLSSLFCFWADLYILFCYISCPNVVE